MARCVFKRVVTVVLLGTGAVAIVAGCQPGPRERYRRGLAETGRPALHAVHSDRLREVMADLERYALRDMPQEVDSQRSREDALRAANNAAEGLISSSKYIRDALTGVRMGEEDRKVFISLTDKLSVQAVELQQAISEGKVNGTSDRMDQVLATCNACHTAFRILPVVK